MLVPPWRILKRVGAASRAVLDASSGRQRRQELLQGLVELGIVRR